MQSINVGVVHQEKITGITVGLLWDSPVFITHVCILEKLEYMYIHF